jgi:hypothetical protein
MTVKIGFYPPASAYEGWSVAVSKTGQPGTWKRVPAKLVTDHHGSSYYVAYDSKEEARKAAKRYAARVLA